MSSWFSKIFKHNNKTDNITIIDNTQSVSSIMNTIKYSYKDDIDLDEKRELKHEVKNKIKKHWYIGNIYNLKTKSRNGSKELLKTFVLKKYVYTINNHIINAVVMKQIAGINNSIYTLNKYDCKRLHLKFEHGLQVFPMELNWNNITLNKK